MSNHSMTFWTRILVLTGLVTSMATAQQGATGGQWPT